MTALPFAAIYESLWREYLPLSSVGKKAAMRHMGASIHTMKDVDDCYEAIRRYKASRRVAAGFIMNGSTFFNNWRDWVHFVEPQRGHRSVGGQEFEGVER